MDRRHLTLRAFAFACACGLALADSKGSVAQAQQLDSLHVRAFTLSTDNLQPRVGQPFHLTITAHVDEQIAELDNVTLPDLSGFDTMGDERRCTATAKGTDCTEVLTLAPDVAGDRTIASATMDAIDASDKKPSRFASNSLRLRIGGPGLSSRTFDGYVAELFWDTVRSFLILVVVASVLWFVLWRFARPRALTPATVPVVPQPPPGPQPVVDDFDARYRFLVATLQAQPTRANASAVRDALRASLGAREKETLADLVARNAAGDRPQRLSALRAIERPVFCEDAFVADNIREAQPFLTI